MNNIDFKNEYLKLCKDCSLIGSNIVITSKDKILESYHYGYKINNKELTDEDTIYRIASISKTVLSIGLMILVEQNKISLDEDISTYLGYTVRNPKYPDVPITVKMITLQTSSIQDGYDDENPLYDDIRKGYNGVNGYPIDVSLQELLTDTSSKYYTSKTYGDYIPGTRFCYSNFGCGIMACIIEKASNEYYHEFMENHVFKPLGLDASFKASRIKNKDKISNMYYYTSNGLYEKSKDDFINSTLKQYELGNNYRGPAGGLFISMKDLSKITRMFINYGCVDNIKILSRESVEFMYQMQWNGTTDDEYCAKGIQMRILQSHPGFPLRGHTGGAYGVRSYMFFSLKDKLGICFITNGVDQKVSSPLIDKVFFQTQRGALIKYTNYIATKVIYKQNEIHLIERKIVEKDLFLANNRYIKALSLADSLNILGHFNEKELTYTFNTFDSSFNITKVVTVKDIIYYNNMLYVPFIETLVELGIPYNKDKDSVTITI